MTACVQHCSLPGLLLRVSADNEVKSPISGGTEPERLKSVSSRTATDWTKGFEQPPARIDGVVGQQLTPYLHLKCLCMPARDYCSCWKCKGKTQAAAFRIQEWMQFMFMQEVGGRERLHQKRSYH